MTPVGRGLSPHKDTELSTRNDSLCQNPRKEQPSIRAQAQKQGYSTPKCNSKADCLALPTTATTQLSLLKSKQKTKPIEISPYNHSKSKSCRKTPLTYEPAGSDTISVVSDAETIKSKLSLIKKKLNE